MQHPSSIRLVLSTLALAAFAAAQSPFTPGNLVISRVGDGSVALSGAAAPRFLDEYTPAGVLVQTITLPTVASGGNFAFTASGSATSEGFVSQSADGRYLILAGYSAVPGTAAVVATTAAATPRVIARVALDGTVDTSTGLVDAYSANNIRSAASTNGIDLWTAGTATATNGPGVRYTTLGATTTTQLSTSPTNTRVVNIAAGQIYASAASGAFQGVATVGTGLPTTSGQTTTLLNGFPTATGPGAYDYYFADANTLYVADDRVTVAGGIQKWVLAVGTWTLVQTLNPAAGVGCRGISGFTEGGVTTLFATTTNNLLVSVVDTGPSSAFTTLVTGVANTALRDVQFVRTPSSVTYSGTSCANSFGTPTVAVGGGLPVAGNASFAINAGNCGPANITVFLLRFGPVLPFGVPLPSTPACALVYVAADAILPTFSDLAGAATLPIAIPNNASIAGVELANQVASFDFSLVGFDLPIGTSDAMSVILGN
jgi:hypothetical protein